MKINKLPMAVCAMLILAGFIASCLGGDGDDGPDKSLYTVFISDMTGGSVTSTYDEAKKDTTVRLTVKPDNGYQYNEGSLSVRTSDDSVTLSAGEPAANGDPRFTFTMPGNNVTVTCTFSLITIPGGFSVSVGAMSGGTVTSSQTSNVYENTSITLTVKPDNTYLYVEGSLKANNGAVALTAAANDTQGYRRWTFKMPAGNVTVTCTFESANSFFSKDFDTSICSFDDKFEGPTVDLTKWGYQNGNGSQYGDSGWGNNESQSYKTENAVIENGILKLIAKRENFDGKNFTSAKLVTAGSKGNVNGEPAAGAGNKFAQTYGRFEAKIRMSKAFKGAWPAFWMLPVDNAYGTWPRSGEIDILEMVGIKPKNGSSTLHVKPDWGTWQSTCSGVSFTFQNNSDFTDWHVYSAVWSANEITFLVDGFEVRTLQRTWWNTSWYAANGFAGNTTAPFNRNFHLILNLALDSGQFDPDNGVPSNTQTANLGNLEIEWVRCYTQANDPWPKSFGQHPAGLRTYYTY
jgi:beta-glucanase (GH16 family)/ethanolamine utilization protein EutQ (cupin superfamily)